MRRRQGAGQRTGSRRHEPFMNLRFLRTLVTISEQPTFSAASESLGLSLSAISLHIKALEEEFQVNLVDRSRRPLVLTDRGIAVVEHARRILAIQDEILSLSSSECLVGSLRVGVVPTAQINLLPPALAQLRATHPQLRINMVTGLSAELAQHVRNREMDVAILTEPEEPLEGLRARIVCKEPYFVIAPPTEEGTTDADLLTSHPFIWFNPKTWAGQQIQRMLMRRRIFVRDVMEVNSLEAIEALVQHGLGVSIVPNRACAPPFASDLRVVPFGTPQEVRTLAMLERSSNPRARLADALLEQLRNLAGGANARSGEDSPGAQ